MTHYRPRVERDATDSTHCALTRPCPSDGGDGDHWESVLLTAGFGLGDLSHVA